MFYLFLSLVISKKIRPSKKQQIEVIEDDSNPRNAANFTIDELKQIEVHGESHQYEAEITRVMNILVGSIYQNKDIFMREIISNANDALDKIRFHSLRDPSVLSTGKNLEILIDINEEDKTISVTDTGIGMTKQELIENLGRIAKSGTSEFQKMLQTRDTNLIGQFGVGFYSAFLVSDHVTVISKSNNDSKQWIWQSDASAHFTVVEDPRGVTLGRGTSVIMHLKDSEYDYVDRDRIMNIIRHYSMFVDFPVKIWHYTDTFEEEPTIANTKTQEELEDIFGKDVDEDSDDDTSIEHIKMDDHSDDDNDSGVQKKRVWSWVVVNDRKPIWLRDPSEVKENDYNEFFTMFFKEMKPPLLHTHFKAEGRVIFNSLFFIPSIPPPSENLFEHTTRNVRLYVKRILVADEWGDELLPDYLHFVKGIIDSNDLSLNVDRDRLVKLNALKMIKRRVTGKVLSMIRDMFLNDPLKYATFYKSYSGNIKYGIVEDTENKRLLSKLLMFYTTYSPKKLTTLDDYIARMKKGQEKIYWIGASSLEEALRSPYTEDLLSRGIEVLFAIEPIDVYCFEKMDEFDGIPLSNPERCDEKVDEKVQDVSEFNISQKLFNRYVRWFQKVIGEKLETVLLSKRLKTTPAICSATSYGYTASHERLLRAQTVHDKELDENIFMNKKILELNFDHPMIKDLLDRIKRTPGDKAVKNQARLLYDTALLAGGFTMVDTQNYTRRVFRMVGKSHGLQEEVKNFEEENNVFYPRILDDYEKKTMGQKVIRLGKKASHPKLSETGDEEPADIHPATPPEAYEGIL